MNILIIGPPGAGKGVQSDFLKKEFGLNIVAFGELLRKEISNKTELGVKIENIVKSGSFIDDEIIFSILNKNLEIYSKNILLDGFPRNLNQALFLEKINFKFDYIFKLNVKECYLLKRIKYRLISSNSSKSYNIIYNKPKIKNIDDDTGSLLYTRLDDKYFSFKNRLNYYTKETDIILKYFTDKDIRVIDINAEKSFFDVFKEIKSYILK